MFFISGPRFMKAFNLKDLTLKKRGKWILRAVLSRENEGIHKARAHLTKVGQTLLM
jgi:hypothetical protein